MISLPKSLYVAKNGLPRNFLVKPQGMVRQPKMGFSHFSTMICQLITFEDTRTSIRDMKIHHFWGYPDIYS